MMKVICSLLMFLLVTSTFAFSQSADDWNKKGIKLFNEGRYEEAIRCYDEALALKPDAYKIWLNRGNACYKLGYYEKACGSYNEALKYKSDFIPAYTSKGKALKELQRYDDAIECFNNVLYLSPNDVEAQKLKKETEELKAKAPSAGKIQELMYRADAAYDEGNYVQAIACYEAVLAIDPNNKDAITRKAKAEVLAAQKEATPTPRPAEPAKVPTKYS